MALGLFLRASVCDDHLVHVFPQKSESSFLEGIAQLANGAFEKSLPLAFPPVLDHRMALPQKGRQFRSGFDVWSSLAAVSEAALREEWVVGHWIGQVDGTEGRGLAVLVWGAVLYSGRIPKPWRAAPVRGLGSARVVSPPHRRRRG